MPGKIPFCYLVVLTRPIQNRCILYLPVNAVDVMDILGVVWSVLGFILEHLAAILSLYIKSAEQVIPEVTFLGRHCKSGKLERNWKLSILYKFATFLVQNTTFEPINTALISKH